MRLNRRVFLGSSAVLGVSACSYGTKEDSGQRFWGLHQPGITQRAPVSARFTAFQVTCDNRDEVKQLCKTLTESIGKLTEGYQPEAVGIASPPSDSGTLGQNPVSDGLAITVGLGDSFFDDRFGMQAQKPKRLKKMRAFPNDDLKPQWCHGDMLIQVRANHIDTVMHAVREIARHTRGALQPAWAIDGFIPPARPQGTPRNHFGFKDGIAQPELTDADKLLWTSPDDLPWTKNGTYHVIRLISMLTEFWDRISLTEQENIFGRNRATGAPLDGNKEHDIPNYNNDPTGSAIPLNSHMRLANPRDKGSYDSQIYRQAYNYVQGLDANGNVDVGLIFNCYQQDITRQFEAIQLRLVDEPLVDYIVPFGGGYFFIPPGVASPTDYLAQGLFEN